MTIPDFDLQPDPSAPVDTAIAEEIYNMLVVKRYMRRKPMPIYTFRDIQRIVNKYVDK